MKICKHIYVSSHHDCFLTSTPADLDLTLLSSHRKIRISASTSCNQNYMLTLTETEAKTRRHPTASSHLKCKSLNTKCVSTIPVVFTLDLNTSCSHGR